MQVTVVLVSPLSTGFVGEGFVSGSDCELMESQSFSLSGKREAFRMESQEGMSMENSSEEVPPATRRKVHEVDCGVNHGWAAVHQAVARRMLSYLDTGEVLKVNARQLKACVLAPNEPNVDIEHTVIMREVKDTKDLQAFSRQGANEILVASVARWETSKDAHHNGTGEPGALPGDRAIKWEAETFGRSVGKHVEGVVAVATSLSLSPLVAHGTSEEVSAHRREQSLMEISRRKWVVCGGRCSYRCRKWIGRRMRRAQKRKEKK